MDIKVTIKKNLWGEFVVRLFYKGVHQTKLDYFADDMEDAKGTAVDMRKRFENTVISQFMGNAKQKGMIQR